jgi:hypothetical protein
MVRTALLFSLGWLFSLPAFAISCDKVPLDGTFHLLAINLNKTDIVTYQESGLVYKMEQTVTPNGSPYTAKLTVTYNNPADKNHHVATPDPQNFSVVLDNKLKPGECYMKGYDYSGNPSFFYRITGVAGNKSIHLAPANTSDDDATDKILALGSEADKSL